MAELEGSTSCCGCGQPCHVKEGILCCPSNCERCKIKNCKNEKECKCSACNCGCKEFFVKEKKSCKESGCPDCVGLCKDVQPGDKCLCSTCNCGCEQAFRQNKRCYEEYSKCPECKKKCQNSNDGDCICYLCNCGCNGVNCQCCRWCNPDTRCGEHGECDSEEKHGENCPKWMCANSKNGCADVKCMCDDMGVSAKHHGQCVCRCRCGRTCPKNRCIKSKHGAVCRNCFCITTQSADKCECICICNCNAYGKYYCKEHKANSEGCNINKCTIIFYGIGKCRFPCTNCGRLCDQDRCMIWIRVIVIGLIILASLFVMRAIFPEKFKNMMTKLRAAFPISSRRPSSPLNNLVGDRVPEEMNTDGYSFRPMSYAGLS